METHPHETKVLKTFTSDVTQTHTIIMVCVIGILNFSILYYAIKRELKEKNWRFIVILTY